MYVIRVSCCCAYVLLCLLLCLLLCMSGTEKKFQIETTLPLPLPRLKPGDKIGNVLIIITTTHLTFRIRFGGGGLAVVWFTYLSIDPWGRHLHLVLGMRSQS